MYHLCLLREVPFHLFYIPSHTHTHSFLSLEPNAHCTVKYPLQDCHLRFSCPGQCTLPLLFSYRPGAVILMSFKTPV